MKNNSAITILFFALIISNACAQGVSQIEITIQENGSATVKEFYEIDTQDMETFIRKMDHARVLKLADTKGEITQFYTTVEKLEFQPREKSPNYSFNIHYTTQFLTTKTGDSWKIEYSHPPDVEIISTKLFIPKNMKILQTNPAAAVYSNDNSLVLEWDTNSLISAVYSIDDKESPFPITYLAFALLALVVLAGYFFSAKKTIEKEVRLPQIAPEQKTDDKILRYLNENEAKIITKLTESKTPLTQRKLQVELGLPKSSLSRAIKKLELRGIIRRAEIGNTNLIELAPDKT